MRFDQGVKALPNSIVVRDARRHGRLGGDARRTPIRTRSSTTLRTLPRGAYTVRWHALSSDGHVVSGVWTFGVGVAAPPPTEAYGASGPTRTEHVVRWAYFVALALLIGGLGFRLLIVRGPLPPRAESRFFKLTGLGVVAVLEVGIVAFLLRAEDALQLPFGDFLYGDLSPIAGGTRFGTAFIAMTLGFALVAALLFLAWLLERRVLLWLAFALALGFASGLSLSGHSAADAGSSWKSELADWVHLSAACLWLGGLVQLALVVWPLAPELRREAFLRYARLAPVLIALLVTAGVYLSILRLPHVSDLWTQSYGHVLLVKLALVSVALAWGGLHHMVGAAARRARSSARGEALAQPARRGVDRDGGAARRGGARRLEAAAAARAAADTSRYGLSDSDDYAISGGAGFLGLHLARHFVAQSHEVRTLDVVPIDDPVERDVDGDPRRHARRRERARALRRRRRRSSTLPRRCRSAARAARSCRSTSTARRRCWRPRATQAFDRVVYISSTAVYGVPKVHPLREDSPLVGVGPYGESKIACERLVRGIVARHRRSSGRRRSSAPSGSACSRSSSTGSTTAGASTCSATGRTATSCSPSRISSTRSRAHARPTSPARSSTSARRSSAPCAATSRR